MSAGYAYDGDDEEDREDDAPDLSGGAADEEDRTPRQLDFGEEGPEEARTPSAATGGDLTAEQLAAAATVPQQQVPDEVDQILADNPAPGGTPYPTAATAPPPPRTAPKTSGIQAQEAEALAEGQALTDQQIEAEQKKLAAKKKVADAAAATAAEQARIQQEHAQRQTEITDAANTRTQQWMDRAQVETDKYMKMGLHDYYQGKGTWQKVLAGASMAIGSAARPGDNPGLNIINQAIERDFRQQQQGILKQKENVDLAKQGVNDSLTQKQNALADNNLKKAAAYDAAAAQGVALKLKQGATLEEANSDVAIVSLRQAANRTRLETLKVIHAQNVQDAHLRYEQTRANAAMIAANARAKKGRGGGGGGAGGLPSIKEQSKMAELSTKIDGMVQKVVQNTGYKEAATQNRKYNQMAVTIAGAKDNAALAAAGAGQFVKMAQGGTGVISDSDMKQFWGRIGGVPDRVENYIETALSGKMGPAKQKIVADAVRDLGRAAKGELESIGAQIETRLNGEAADIPWVKSRIPVYLDTYVPGLRQGGSGGGGGGGKPLSTRDKALKIMAEKTVKDPKADPQTKKDAQAYLDRIGG